MFLPSEKKAPETKSQRQEDDLEVGGIHSQNQERLDLEATSHKYLFSPYSIFVSDVPSSSYVIVLLTEIVGGMIKTIYNDETQTIQRVMLRILIGSYTQFSEVDRAEYQSSTTATRQWNSGYQSISNSRDSS
ncbi:hypothetical protein F2Q68_00045417 [Brassica cretica]|uniref:Uncharacterized protein n=1 Tax=Brassica cretica TaxID=69181 RepID=A0A8S9LMY5_BRACR|nr:hypothetical protein F2Q68_00045417 [Brassica cretica]